MSALREHTERFAPSGTDSALSVKLLVRASDDYVYGRPTGTGTGVQQERKRAFVRAFNGNFTMTRTVDEVQLHICK